MGLSLIRMDVAALEKRKEGRLDFFMKVIAKEISQFPGCVEDVSPNGCKIRFPDAESLDMEGEYSVTVYCAQGHETASLSLLLKPRWVQKSGAGAQIGFTILRSPGYKAFFRLVERLAEAEPIFEAAARQDILP